MSRRRLKAISPVIAAVVLIGVAIAGALLLGYYMTTTIKSSNPKGAAIAVSGVELYYLGTSRVKQGWNWKTQYDYAISVKLANSGTDPATITKIEIIGTDSQGQWGTRYTINVNKKIMPGETYSDTWTFSLNNQDIQVGKTYVVKISYTDPYGNTKSVSVNIMCRRGVG
ncbi:MAG: hypothetical protein GXO43_00755 [Crenarchaeota archaeon]|nr:hypothetical protein [Thermoproteota archaeon]